MRHIRLASLLLGFAATRLIAAEPESASSALREPVVLSTRAVVYPQGTDPDLLTSPKSGFGPEQHVVNIPFTEFFPFNSAGTYTSNWISDGSRFPISGTALYAATIDAGLVPNGADLQQVAFYFADDNPGMNLAGYVCRAWVHSDGSSPEADCPVSIFSSGAPGYGAHRGPELFRAVPGRHRQRRDG